MPGSAARLDGASDRDAVQNGHGQDLARALTALTHTDRRRPRRLTMLDTHPDLHARMDDLSESAQNTAPSRRHLAAA